MKIFSLFQKPKNSIAFSLDHGTLRYVSVTREKTGIQVNRHDAILLDADVISEDDTIIDDAKFVQVLRKVATQIHPSGQVDANFVVPDYQAIMFHTHITKDTPAHMNDIIVDHLKTYCEAHDLLDFTDYICEYDVILETAFGYDIHATLVPKTYTSHIARLFKQAGITLHHIETAHHAVAQSCLDIPSGTGVVLVSFGQFKTTVTLVHGNHLVSQQVVPVGFEIIFETIQSFLNSDRDYTEKIVDRHGVLPTHPDSGLLGELFEKLAPIYHSIDHQLIAVGQIGNKHFGHRFSTDTVLMYGEGVFIKGMTSLLADKTGLHVKALDVWAGHDQDRAPVMQLHADDVLAYAEPLSLALLYLDKK